MPSPLVSVIIAVYNGAQFLGMALDSVAAQHYRAAGRHRHRRRLHRRHCGRREAF